jgi:hypothetical protein
MSRSNILSLLKGGDRRTIGRANKVAALCPKVVDILRTAARMGTPAMKARGRKLLARLERLM